MSAEHVLGEALRVIAIVSIVVSGAIGVWALVFEAIDAYRYSRALHAAKARAPFS